MQILPIKSAHGLYSESGQTNPLRWIILHRKEEGVFQKQTNVFKCKDYFNDFVAKYHGFNLGTVHEFPCDSVEINEEGVWVLLTCLNHQENLIHNIGIINTKLVEDGLPILEPIKEGNDILLLLPRGLFCSTYTMSFVTYLIRVSHCEKKMEKFADFVDYTATIIDNPFRQYRVKVLQGKMTGKKESWYNLGSFVVTDVNRITAKYSIHNNGCYDWCVKEAMGL